MNSITRKVTALGLAAALIGLAGCSMQPKEDEETAMKVWGYVAAEKSAQLEIAENQQGVDELIVSRVLSPGDAWLVVHADDNGKPGMRVGLKHVSKGESTDVKVELEETPTPKVIVALHADRGNKDEFDFDMMNKEMSPDRPFFVNEEELAKVVTVREFGVKAESGQAAIEVADQPGADGSLTVDRALAPTGAWIVVHLDDEGAPGQRVGLQQIPAGENTDVEVKLDPLTLTDKLFVAVHADRGAAGTFEFDMMDKVNSADQPFFVGGEEVAKAVVVK
ncbi:MAG TPA: hypothetical protein VLA05_06850 [Coriobacteriia bacterium]|nr:hypothetical protein [Coriobacteriia bacterium]